MNKKITLTNVKQFFQGYGRMFYNKLIGLPKHEQEQIEYRAALCKHDCAYRQACIKCGCNFPGRIFTSKTCNTDRFPDIMPEKEWKEFKIKNNIV